MTTAMPTDEIIVKTAAHVRELFASDSSGHDWWHIDRVWRTALTIAQREGADLVVVQLAALLHDIADWKFHDGDDKIGPRLAADWLAGLGVDAATIDHVSEIIRGVTFKGAGVATPMRTLEGSVVQDADRLDAIGAIGIARAFAYGGHAGRAMYDPETRPKEHASFAAYKKKIAARRSITSTKSCSCSRTACTPPRPVNWPKRGNGSWNNFSSDSTLNGTA